MKKRFLSILCMMLALVSLAACGGKTDENNNSLARAQLTPREQMLAGNQDIFMYDFKTDSTYKSVSIYIEAYENGKKLDDIANLQCALPQPSKKKETYAGSIAVMLRPDMRFHVSVCNAEGTEISAHASDAVQPIADLNYKNIVNRVSTEAPLAINGDQQTLAYLAYGEESKTQGTFPESVFLDPLTNAEQAAVFDRIYLVKCRFS